MITKPIMYHLVFIGTSGTLNGHFVGKIRMDEKLALLQPDSADSTPIYLQLAKKIRAAVESGQWRSGDALPSERALMEAFGIARGTARRAFQHLEQDGTINRNRGSGTFIAPRFVPALPLLESFTEMVEPQGFRAQSELIGFLRRGPTAEEMQALQLSDEQDVVELVRLRKAGEIAIALQYSVLPATILPASGLPEESLYHYLLSIDKPILRATQRFRGEIADNAVARYLALEVGEPLLLVTRTGFTQDEHPIEYTRSWCLNDYYDFALELKR